MPNFKNRIENSDLDFKNAFFEINFHTKIKNILKINIRKTDGDK